MKASESVTVILSVAGRSPAFELCYESYVKHHGKPHKLHVLSHPNMPDDAIPYISKVADWHEITESAVSHGPSLDYLIKTVETEFTLALDHDIEFLEPILPHLLWEIQDCFCISAPSVCDLGTTELYGVLTEGQPRIDPYCTLFRTKEMQQIVEHISWGSYGCRDTGKHWDVGGMVWQASKAAGLKTKFDMEIINRVKHYGTLIWGLVSPPESEAYKIASERYEIIKTRLSEIRASG